MTDIKVPAATARSTDPDTSQWAAETVRTRRQMRHLISSMSALAECYSDKCGYTDQEIYNENKQYYHDTEQGLRSRREDAVRLGLVREVDRKGLSPNGRACKRRTLTQKGRDVNRILLSEALKSMKWSAGYE